MRRVIPAALRGLSPPELSKDGNERRIEDRHKKHQHRNRQYRDDPTRAAAGLIQQNRCGQQKSDKHRAAVAHENGRRVEIKDEKAK